MEITSTRDRAEENRHELGFLRPVFVVLGAVFGFVVLAMITAGAANAAERPTPPLQELLGQVGHTMQNVSDQVDPVLRPVTTTVSSVSEITAPVVVPVIEAAAPVLQPVLRPVTDAVAPVLAVVKPVTEPLTKPLLKAVDPVITPVSHALDTDRLVEAAGGNAVPRVTEHSAAGRSDQGVVVRSDLPVFTERQIAGPWVAEPDVVPVRSSVPLEASAGVVADHASAWLRPVSGGGSPLAPPQPVTAGLSGSAVTGGSGHHGGEFAATLSGSGMPGTGQSWRPPPPDEWPLHWLTSYGNDYPS